MKKEQKEIITKELNNINIKYNLINYVNIYYSLVEDEKKLKKESDFKQEERRTLAKKFLNDPTTRNVNQYKTLKAPIEKNINELDYKIKIQEKTLEAYHNIIEKVLNYILIDVTNLYINYVKNMRDDTEFKKLINIYDSVANKYIYNFYFRSDFKNFEISFHNNYYDNFNTSIYIVNQFLFDDNNNYYLSYDKKQLDYYCKNNLDWELYKENFKIDKPYIVKNSIKNYLIKYNSKIEKIKNIINETNEELKQANKYGIASPLFSPYLNY